MLMHQRGNLAAHGFACGGIALLQGLIGEHKVYFVCAICQGLLCLRQHIRQWLIARGEIDHGGNIDAAAFRQSCAALGNKRRIHAHGGNLADALRGVAA